MAELIATMFGKAYDTVGSADKNLILQTRGDLKIKWGGKYIDLIKNGKINADTDVLKKIDSKDSIYKDGLYLIEKEETPEVWLSIGGSTVNLLGEASTTYVSFLSPQKATPDQKLIALTNAGFYYETLDKAKEAEIKQGIIYIIDEQQFYKVKDGEYSKYEQQLNISNPLILGQLTINGTTEKISGEDNLYFGLKNSNYISFTTDKINIEKEIIVHDDFKSNDYVINKNGYRLYIDYDGLSTLEIDKVIIRQLLVYEEIVDVTYTELQNLIKSSKLIPTKKYKIIDFQNEWEVTSEVQYYDETIPNTNPIQGKAKNVWPIVVEAKTNNTLRPNFYFYENDNWKGEYDVTFNYFIRKEIIKDKSYNLYSKGRITKLVDEKNNQANYDFKHKLFKYSSTSDNQNNWYYTFNVNNPQYGLNTNAPYTYENTHIYADASQYKDEIANNILYLPEPILEDITITEDGISKNIKKIVSQDNYIIFTDCSTIYPHDNTILDSLGKYSITSNFYNNTFLGLYDNTEQEIQFTSDFHDNIFQKVQNCMLNASMRYNTFNQDIIQLNIQNATIDRCLFKEIINNASISGNLTKCQFEGLSNGITITGPLNDMTIQSDITPNSADYVQDKDVITDYINITSLIISQQVVPRLAENLHKECFVDIRGEKKVFIVQLSTDDNTPKGVIVMWSGNINNVPAGYGVCDGRIINGIQLPNLSGRFIKMIDSNESIGPVDNQDLESDGKSIKIKQENLPNHTHNIEVTVEQYSKSSSYVSSNTNKYVNEGQGDSIYSGDNINIDNIDLTHSHNATAINIDNYANTPINIQPNYYALIFIMKL